MRGGPGGRIWELEQGWEGGGCSFGEEEGGGVGGGGRFGVRGVGLGEAAGLGGWKSVMGAVYCW